MTRVLGITGDSIVAIRSVISMNGHHRIYTPAGNQHPADGGRVPVGGGLVSGESSTVMGATMTIIGGTALL